MLQLTVSKDVAAPPARVYEVATDLRNAAGRIRGITKLEVLTEGPLRVGTRFRETRKMFGREATAEMEFVALDPPNSYVLVSEIDGCRYRTQLVFAPKGAGTDLQFHFSAEPLSFARKVMVVLMKPFLKKMMALCARDLDDIAKHAEASLIPSGAGAGSTARPG